MTGWLVQLDPPAVKPDRAMLDLNAGAIAVGGTSPGTSIDWGTAAINSYLAQQGRYGQGMIDWDLPNRTVTIPLLLGADDVVGGVTEEEARALLQQKVGLLQREGGALLRQRDGGPAAYLDIVYAEITVPDVWGETGGIESDLSLVLTCLPDFYGDEVTLDAMASSNGVLSAVLQQDGENAVIVGDYPARTRIQITDTSGADRHGLIYGLRSRHYDDATTAALVYEAEDLSPINGATLVDPPIDGAAGDQVAELVTVSADEWTPLLLSSLADGTALTHRGTYRVLVRLAVDAGTPDLRLVWSVGSLAVPIANDRVTLSGAEWELVDLGVVRLDPQPVGANAWYGVIETYADIVGRKVYVDQLILEPLDESAGALTYVPSAGDAPLVLSPVATQGTMSQLGAEYQPDIQWQIFTDYAQVDNTPGGLNPTAETGYTRTLVASTFGFAVPDTATILGVSIQLGYNLHRGTASEGSAELVVGGTPSQVWDGAEGQSLAPLANTTITYGGAMTTWKISLTPDDVNADDFGFAWSILITEDSAGSFMLDVTGVTATVYYQLESGFAIPNDAVLYASRSAELRSEGMRRTYDGNVYGPISVVTGDLPRLPPSGAEQRPCELLVRPSAGEFDAEADSVLGDFTVQVSYWPCWLSRP